MNYSNMIFDLLDQWRHLPSYQLERRADIFFAVYLPEIVRRHLGFDVVSIIPEFPVRIGSIVDDSNSNQSFKVDYLVRAKAGNRVALIELKTDMRSKRQDQEEYLKAAKQLGMAGLLEGVVLILAATSQEKKYQALMDELDKAGFLHRMSRQTFDIPDDEYDVEIVYIQPHREELPYASVISFGQIAGLLRSKRDGFGSRFAESLDSWSNIESGGG